MNIFIVKTARTDWRDDVTTEIVTTDFQEAMNVAITCRNFIEPDKDEPISQFEEDANSGDVGEITDFEIWRDGKKVFWDSMEVGRFPFEQKKEMEITDIVNS